MEKKYKLSNNTIKYKGITLHRIEALKNFGDVKAGDLGGFVESENNLSQDGNCWIYDDSKVCNRAKVLDNAALYDSASIYENAIICDCATILHRATVCGKAGVHNNARVSGYACIDGYATIKDRAIISNYANISDDCCVCENAVVCGYSELLNNACISDKVIIRNSIVDNTIISGYATICNTEIYSKKDYIVFKNWWSSGRYFTWTRNNNMWNVGCFYGTGKELIEKAYQDSKEKGIEYERVVNYVNSIIATKNEKESI